MPNLANRRVSILLLAVMASSCGGGKAPPTQYELNTKISDIALEDPILQTCVDAAAKENGWQTLGEVTELECDFYGFRYRFQEALRIQDALTSQSEVDDLQGIVNTAGIEWFTELEKLSLTGHYYSEIDVSTLAKLKNLDLNSSFIGSLDLSNNAELEELDIAGTLVTDLNLSGLEKLSKVYAGGKSVKADATLEGTIEQAGEYFGLNYAEFEQALTDVTFDPEAFPVDVDIYGPPPTNLNPESLSQYSGTLEYADFVRATQLTSFIGSINNAPPYLDLEPYNQLIRMELTAVAVAEIAYGTQLEQLKANANVHSLYPLGDKPESNLWRLELNAIEGGRFDPELLAMEYLEDSLAEVVFTNYFFARAIGDFSKFSALKRITLNDSAIDISWQLPESIEIVTLINEVGRAYINSEAGPKHLHIGKASDRSCSMENFNIAQLEHLSISGCGKSSVDLSGVSSVRNLTINHSDLDSIDLTQVPSVEHLDLSHNQFVDLDLSPLSTEVNRRNFIFTDNPLIDGARAKIEEQANSRFFSVALE